ncbi:phage tail sheath family protein [Pseudomonas sp. NPDC090755]|uniref:phage tail sheath family protein n=1 Tax=Pseudomonas sp. NPDC090755 TaxID=3364481 RepID=UPI00383B1CB0
MAEIYKTPGVYIKEVPKLPPSIAAVETAIPAFIGYTEKTDSDELKKPFRITSMVEYEQYFGGADPEDKITVDETKVSQDKVLGKFKATLKPEDRSKHIMYYALQMFFANGGGPCYIVSVGDYGGSIKIDALSEGLKLLEAVDEPTLILFPEAQYLESISDFKTLITAALEQCEKLKDRFVIMDVHWGDKKPEDPKSNITNVISDFRNDGIGGDNLKYGAAYAPNLHTVLEYVIDPSKTKVSYGRGEKPKKEVNLDALKQDDTQAYESAMAAIRDLPCILPPSAAIAGIYASVDAERGVWKAPANVSLRAVIKPTIEISHEQQESINEDATTGKSVNAIRAFTGKGTLVWGARTLAGNDNEWRYVNVRRLFTFIEESIDKAITDFCFEPNDANTWVRVQAMCENFLTVLWRQGALQGIKPEHAFCVSVGLNKTMSNQDILEGRMKVEIGLAAVRPAEFIILYFSHKLAQS